MSHRDIVQTFPSGSGIMLMSQQSNVEERQNFSSNSNARTHFKSMDGTITIALGEAYRFSSQPTNKDLRIERDIDVLSAITEGGGSAFEFDAESEAIRNHSTAVEKAARSLIEAIALKDISIPNGSSSEGDDARLTHFRTAGILMVPERDRNKFVDSMKEISEMGFQNWKIAGSLMLAGCDRQQALQYHIH